MIFKILYRSKLKFRRKHNVRLSERFGKYGEATITIYETNEAEKNNADKLNSLRFFFHEIPIKISTGR